MATHNETGKKGEALAVAWLQNNGFEILHCNWRHARFEIDIIATRNSMLHFIEVKTRTNKRFGYPEESVSVKKLENIFEAASFYLENNAQWTKVRYDILSILFINDDVEYFFIEDVC
jgi:putative endonuclease